jgi:maltose alpha-D-glucosyltransferase/alpha-amylase
MTERKKNNSTMDEGPLWYKDAVIYELHVRAFHDLRGDGMGDFRGLAEKLDYLQDLGVTAIWLLPFYPSPLRDDGYDTASYTEVHSNYGTLSDFRVFLREAHARGLRVITELVLNHTSDQHPWFQRARRAPAGSPLRDFYVWSDTQEKYKGTRIIFKDFEVSNWTWDPVAKAYYWHRFYSHQPDLNFDNPEVHKALFQVVDFWMEMGVDGLRLDAVPYLYEREGTNCENLAETHEFLKLLRRHVDENFPDRMLLAEANQWPEDAVAYFGEGDECHMAFHFPLMPRLFMSIRMEDRYPVIDILSQTPAIPPSSQWALFLRNHDELTLEMVTDEERDYMHRMFASDPTARINLGIRRRLAPLLENDRPKIELMNGLLFSLPGTPVVYYGDEIGMGDNIYLGDRNGVRTPMQWSPDRNAGFSRASSQKLYLPVITEPAYHYESVNVEAHQDNPHSLLWWMKRLIAMRKRYRAFGRGSLEFLYPANHRVLAFIRRFEDEIILVVANISRYAQYVELDLSRFKGMVPVELSGRTEFPPIGDLPYLLTLGAHAFYWFGLEPARIVDVDSAEAAPTREIPAMEVAGAWTKIFDKKHRPALEKLLPPFLQSRRWFGGKARKIKSIWIRDTIPVPHGDTESICAFVSVDYTEGDGELYIVPMTFATGERAEQVERDTPHARLARLTCSDGRGLLFGAVREPQFASALLDGISRRRRFKGSSGEIACVPTRNLRALRGDEDAPLEASLLSAEQSNTSFLYGRKLILKMFRRLEPGVNPDLEINAFLSSETSFHNIPPLAGYLEYKNNAGEVMTLGVLQGWVANQGDAWRYTLDALSRYYEGAATRRLGTLTEALPAGNVKQLLELEVPPQASEWIGAYLESARLLGQRTGEMHLALATAPEGHAFAPEPFTPFYQRSLFQSMRNLTVQTFELLRRKVGDLPEPMRVLAQATVEREAEILERFRSILSGQITALRTRHHGDYHLGQVLQTGNDFVILDFEGEPARSIGERRIRRSPLRDVAGMLRSFHYASYAALLGRIESRAVREEDFPALEPWAGFWHKCVSAVFLKSYLETAGSAAYVPNDRDEVARLLSIYLLEKAIYEVRYELNNRPTWLRIPLEGIRQLLQG